MNDLHLLIKEEKMKNKMLLILMAILMFSTQLWAVELKVSDTSFTETGNFQEDYLFSGEALDFRGQTRDLFFFGETLDFSGRSDLALNGLARNINVSGEVNNGVKAAGRTVDINGNVRGTNFLAGEHVTLQRDGQIAGDSFVGARKLTILGKHKGDLYAGAAEIVVDNVIEGNVKVYTGQLRIPKQGKILGDLSYQSDREITPEEAARVTGNITFEKSEEGFFSETIDGPPFHDSFWPPLIFKLSFIVFGLLLLLFPVNKVLEKQYGGRELLSHSLWGLIPVFVYPSAFVVGLILVITIPVAIALLLSFLPVLFVTKTLGLTMIGAYLAERFNLNTRNRFLYFLMAAIPYSLLSMIPIFGVLLLVFVSTTGCGLLLSKLFNRQFGK